MIRVFYGLRVEAPWPALPQAKLLEEPMRHLTLTFLGDIPQESLEPLLQPLPLSKTRGIGGHFSQTLFLPSEKPRAAAYQPLFYSESDAYALQRDVQSYAEEKLQLSQERRPWTPHVTLGRAPFDTTEWEETFTPFPFVCNELCLYESLGNRQYAPLMTQSLLPPFEEVPHTADYAFRIRGGNVTELYRHAQLALMFLSPDFIAYYDPLEKQHLTECIIALNHMTSCLDRDQGSPIKAVSFHGALQKEENLVSWLMILDV